MDQPNYPVCQVCSKSFKIITATHLKSHGHSFETYNVGQHIPKDWLDILKLQGFKLFDQ